MVRKISQPYRLVRDWIDRTAMYLIVLYMLSILALTAVVAGVFGLVAPTEKKAFLLVQSSFYDDSSPLMPDKSRRQHQK